MKKIIKGFKVSAKGGQTAKIGRAKRKGFKGKEFLPALAFRPAVFFRAGYSPARRLNTHQRKTILIKTYLF
ncbi:MAG: hypothetical protein A2445_03780 [Candidatus Jacksonbacteria bacterium RIFOXYC2_FULL_44_29]|nr:MAG: hypothetical protein A2240_02500 [Candidatus Jacksonbacteria bacterium RIFOXYA2_FULL_43_12]OGY77268.1 MAG: hypothetical protein A2445_03780 [Candidatus Jacksonbacteria bacterium RIFOXYC2_FULL_44_29]OGY77814.1 MAG: hypothetical protein A2295_04415 [Candidatus Jacksonbacteria bacterium RIFOXYB2_FULL_44_15]OGY78298.1 MAG: hypothetical protein A2550_03775 [Candidatus Jacksonbacteria bacterium RIFOXYD2_FULL_43_21]HCC50254.1 hypothetical protein [Candidatus Jacksonbacteria bacterium]